MIEGFLKYLQLRDFTDFWDLRNPRCCKNPGYTINFKSPRNHKYSRNSINSRDANDSRDSHDNEDSEDLEDPQILKLKDFRSPCNFWDCTYRF